MMRIVIQNAVFFENSGEMAANICITAMTPASCVNQLLLGQARDNRGRLSEEDVINIVFSGSYDL